MPLSPKAFDLLLALVENNGKLLSKDDLFEIVWKNQIVEESNLTVNMSQIRKALRDKAAEPRFITTVSGQGYRFVGEVQELSQAGSVEEIIVESRTLERIVVEEETEEAEENINAESFPLRKRAVLLPAPSAAVSFFGRNRAAIFITAGAALIMAVAFGIWSFVFRTDPPRAQPFQQISIKRLTTSGKAGVAALSPDGKLFAYALTEPDGRQSLVLEHVDSIGKQLQLLAPAAVNYQNLTFAPDGSRLYYIFNSNENEAGGLYRLPVFGGATEKVKDIRGLIALAPDGRQIAFVRHDSANRKSSILVADTDGGAEREIVSRVFPFNFASTTVAWSPDGGRLAVSAVADEKTRKQEIFIVNLADNSIRQLTELQWDGVRALAWLKDENGLIANAGERDVGWESQVWHISTENGAARRIVSDLNGYGITASLSADNSKLLTVQGQYFSNIWIAPADNLGAAKQITFDMIGRQTGWTGIDWSPDGQIFYTALTGMSETIWRMDAEGKNQKQIVPTGGNSNNLSLSDDGRILVFVSNRSGSSEIWRADGGDAANLRQLTKDGNNSQPHVSPDGKSVVYNSFRDGVNILFRISSDGGEPVKLAESAIWARVSPDSKLVACAHARDGKTKLAVLSLENGEVLNSFDIPRTANFRYGIRWMPGGRAITYRDWINGIWKQDLDGGEPVRLEGLPQEKLYAYGWSRDGKWFAFTRGMEIRDVVLVSDSK